MLVTKLVEVYLSQSPLTIGLLSSSHQQGKLAGLHDCYQTTKMTGSQADKLATNL